MPGAAEPPPIPYSPTQKHVPIASHGDVFFTDGLLRFLIVNLSLLTILLAANVLVVLRSESIQWSQNSQSMETAEAKSVDDQRAILSGVSIADESYANSHLAQLGLKEPATKLTGDNAERRLASSNSMIVEIKSQPQPATRLSSSSVRTDDSPVRDPIEVQKHNPVKEEIFEDSEVLVIAELTPQRSTDTNPFQTSTQVPLTLQEPTAQVCQPPTSIGPTSMNPTCMNPGQDNDPMREPYYGTKIEWNRQVRDASRKAKSENKLVYLIHVSGNFTKEEFT